MPIKGNYVVCNLCGIKATTKSIKNRIVKFKPYRGDFACEYCLEEVRSDSTFNLPPDAPSPEDLREIEPFLEQ